MDLSLPQQYILQSLAHGANRTAACHAAGVGRRTLYNWMEQNPAFAEAIGVVEDLAFACAMKAAEDPR